MTPSKPSPLQFFALALLVTAVVNVGHWSDPPYWDALTGVYTQGVWLARNHFDYRALAQLPHFSNGGANVFLFYAFAPLFAVLTLCFKPTVVFVILHGVVMTAAAGALTLLYEMLCAAIAPSLAVLWSLGAAFNPIWSGQTASLYLEIPLAATIMLSIRLIWQRRYAWAALACVASYFVKSSAVLYALACAVYGGFLCVQRRASRDFSPLILVAPLIVMILLSLWAPSEVGIFWDIPGYLLFFFQKARFQFPILAFMFVAIPVLLLLRWKTLRDSPDFSTLLLLTIYVMGFWLSFVIESMPLPRYSVMVILPATVALAWLTASSRRQSAVLAGLILLVNLLTLSGRRLPPIPDYRGARSGNELERSREYLKDLEGNRAVCQLLERQFFNAKIVTKSPFTQMLTIPELGYVQQALPFVIEAGRLSAVSHDAALAWYLKRPGTHETLCLYSPNKDELSFGQSLRPKTGENILLEEHSLPVANTLYVRDWDKTPAP